MLRKSPLRNGIATVAVALAATAAHAAPPPLQAEVFERQHPDARSDGFRAAGRVPGLGVVQLDYTRTQFNSPDASHVTSLEWRPAGHASSGFSVRGVERRDGDIRIRTLEIGWRLRF